MESVNQQFDVVIVGGGLVGATLALLLTELDQLSVKQQQLTVGLVEASTFSSPSLLEHRSEHADFDPRVVALTHASEALFQRAGIWSLVQAMRSCSYQGMQVWDAEGTGEIAFSAEDAGVDHLGTIVENRLLVAALHHKIRQQPRITVLENTAVSQLGPMLEDEITTQRHRVLGLDDGQLISGSVVVAADGALSAIRHMAAFDVREWSYHHHAIVTTVQTEIPHGGIARQVFMNEGPLAYLPLPSVAGKHYCSIVWSQVPERANELMAMNDVDFCRVLGDSLEQRLGQVIQTDRRYSIPLTQRHAKQYVKDRIVLVGDAAHTIHPLAGQGVNLGLLDVAVLAEELLSAFDASLDVGGERTLRRYQRRRMGHNLSMMSVMEGFKQLFSEAAPPIRFIRNVGMSLLNQHPLIKRPIIMRAMGLEGDLPELAKPPY